MCIKTIIDEDFTNYKKPSMVIAFPKCSFKCDKECGKPVCQNSALATAPDIQVDIQKLIQRYVNNPITQAVVLMGMEPFDSYVDVIDFLYKFTLASGDDIVIYTGYNKDEVIRKVNEIKDNLIDNKLIIKYGRYVPGCKPHRDPILGVDLASDNQYAEIVE